MRPSLEHIKKHITDPIKECVEVGVCVGSNAAEILVGLQPWRIYLVDTWLPYFEYNTLQDKTKEYERCVNLFKGNPQVHIQRMTSIDASKTHPDKHFDFVYIDANHEYDSVMLDIKSWWPKVKIGGFLCGHDANYQSVNDAVNASLPNPIFLGCDWLARKEL